MVSYLERALMIMKYWPGYLFALTLFLFSSPGNAQHVSYGEAPVSRILFILDASNSMAGQWKGERKMDVAREVLYEMLDSLAGIPNVELALRIYGHQSPVPPQDCSDTKLEVPFSDHSAEAIREKLEEIQPMGTTPIARSLEQAPGDFPPRDNCRNIILLITDGIEACDGDPCIVSRLLQSQGLILRPFVIGIGTDPGFTETFNCIGEFYDAPNRDEFRKALETVISQVLDATTVQVKLLNSQAEALETDVNIIIYDHFTKRVKVQMMHTLDEYNQPDTLSLDPLGTYGIQAQTIPPVYLDSIKLTAGRHNTISVNAPQGYLYLITPKGDNLDGEKILVRRAGIPGTINIQEIGNVGKYLVGTYDLEIPIYPLMLIENVEIKQSNTTTVEISSPGLITFHSSVTGSGTLYKIEKNGDQRWVLNLPEHKTAQSYLLQPGSYRILFRRHDRPSASYTVIREFMVREGSPDHIYLFGPD